ncbi:hexitol phosphatase HxpB [Chitinophaga qingshengii]|uniref:Hexitol phosphatase HxpB n=1 Tax=Chitinophaga qingshengii TaxID=1569794 RepID=A0ABR7TJ00_9BACT|nr:hexitol phosphatase HxpB [Chitinophaga qingshengii]MBC9930487.1 hexitol phosphatase HxpB [Chitinophaga qingshengii]
MINTVIFDMDGLLVDSEPLWGIAMREVFATVGVTLSPELTHKTTGLRTREVVSYWHSYFKWEGKSSDQVTNEIIDSVTAKIIAEGKAMEGLQYILDFFKERDFKIGLASSSPLRLIEAVLAHLNIREHFQAVYSAEFEDYGKPHPAVYLACAKALNSDPLDCIAFEDSVTGMTAAKAARMTTVVVPEPHNRHDPRYALANMQLSSLLDFNDQRLLLLLEH